ncbi:MAG TPA: zinc-binding dehydrogenase [Nevskiaceae bacterium]|nr:zinc-binding dehydrogenase [Nevskiaceae bacterium]
MRAMFIERPGGHGVFAARDLPEPVPAPREVVIDVRAIGINFADVLARQGIYPDAPPYPCCVGYEVSGVVCAAGREVDARWLGREVLALTDFNSYAQRVAVGVDYVWDKPASLPFEQAAAIPLNYLTAWGLLVAMGGLARGDRVLIHNAGGGVGLAALDIARQLGAISIGTASARKHEFLRGRGLDHAVDYTRSDWPAQVRAASGGAGVELAIDPIGGASWKHTYALLAPTGRMGMFGISGAATASGLRGKWELAKLMLGAPLFHPARIIPANRGVYGINIHAMYQRHDKFSSWMQAILRGVAEGWVRPHVDRVFALEQAGEAHRHIEARGNIGKVLLVP